MMRSWKAIRTVLSVLALLAAGWGGWACATNPATGERQLSLIGEESEIQLGRESDEQVVAVFGLYEDDALQRYVNSVGQRLAAESERPDLPWSFKVLDDETVNAMALPGGFIYVTRGILGHMSSEAELAGVLGHEIGHVTARHSVNQLSKQQLAGGLFAVGMAVSPELRQYGDLAGTGLGLLFLKFGRDDERQADELGLRYMMRADYEASEMPGMFEMLERVSRLSEGGRVPTWLATHPNPEARERRAADLVAALDPSEASGTVDRLEYLRAIEGTVFGADPRHGYFVDDRFLHPELAFGLEFPAGWEHVNERQRVVAVGPGRETVFELTLAAEAEPRQAAHEFLAQEGITAGRVWTRSLNSLPAAGARFEATSGTREIRGSVAFARHGGNLYRLLGYGLSRPFAEQIGGIERAMESFHAVTDTAVLSVEPDRLALVEVRRSMTLRAFQEAYPSVIELERLAALNRVEVEESLAAGSMVKRVVGKRPLPDERR